MGWWNAGRASVAACWALWIAFQVVAGDPLIPDISYSQFGVGPHGWVFSLWAVLLGVGPLLLLRFRPVPGRGALVCLLIGAVGAFLMAVVRTDAGGFQQSPQAQIHAAGATAAMVCLPTGIVLALRFSPGPAARISAVLGLASLAGLVCIGLAAAGFDPLGMGQQGAWAFWQGVTVLVDMLVLALYALAVGTLPVRAGAGRPAPSGTPDGITERGTSQAPRTG